MMGVQTTVTVEGNEYSLEIECEYPVSREAGIRMEITQVTGPNEVDVDPETFYVKLERYNPQVLQDLEAECKATLDNDEADTYDLYKKEDMR